MSINRSTLDARPRWPRIVATAGLASLVTVSVTTACRSRDEPHSPPPPPLRLSWPDEMRGTGTDYPFGLAVSPNGRHVAFPSGAVPAARSGHGGMEPRDGRVTLWLHDLATGEARPLPAADGAAMPFWSADGTRLAYFAGGRLRVLEIETGIESDLVDAPAPRGGAWLSSGDLLFAPTASGGLMRYRMDGRRAEPFTEIDATGGEVSHGMPAVAPGSRHVIFHVRSSVSARRGVWWAPIDRPGDRKRLVASDAHAVVAAGYLLFVDDAALMAQRIDVEAGALLGRPTFLAAPIGRGPLGQAFLAVVNEGPLFFGAPRSDRRSLTWLDRSGKDLGSVGAPSSSWDVRIAPAGNRVAVTQVDAQIGTLDIWAYDGSRPLPTRVSAAIETDDYAVWSPDASRLAWVRGHRSVIVRGAQAMLPEETLRTFDGPVRLWDWSPDGRWLIVGLTDAATRDDLWRLPARGDQEAQPIVRSPFAETDAALSPDGRWIAFASDESGRPEIYVDAFPVAGRRSRLTLGGGTRPRWRGDSREIVFRRGRELHAVTLALERGSLEATATTKLFEAPGDIRAYDVTRDGRRFLLNLPAETPAPPVQVIVNWTTLVTMHDAQ